MRPSAASASTMDTGTRAACAISATEYTSSVGFSGFVAIQGCLTPTQRQKPCRRWYRQIWAKMAGICRWCAKCPQNRTLGDAFEEGQSLALGELADRLEAFRLQGGHSPARALIVRIRRLSAAKQAA